MRNSVLTATAAIALCLTSASNLYSSRADERDVSRHGPALPALHEHRARPLSRVKGVKSVAVDWNTKNAKIVFDESVLPAQSLAAAIEGTPHMMGAGMRYGGWLALKVPSITDEASGQKAKEAVRRSRE